MLPFSIAIVAASAHKAFLFNSILNVKRSEWQQMTPRRGAAIQNKKIMNKSIQDT